MYRLIEALEERRLLTLVPDASNVIAIDGSLGADTWEITQVNGILIWKDLISGATNQTAAPFTGSLRIDLRGGDDYLRLRTKTLISYVTVRSTLIGGLGNDTVFGGENHDSIQGDDGDDRLDGRGGRDTLVGGVGFDTADYSYRADPLNITLDGAGNDGGTYGEFDNVQTDAVLGGSAADIIYGDGAANLIDGGAGNDTIAGGLGNDTITGGIGADSIFGEDGNDYLFAKEGLLDVINDGTGIDSASVDSTVVGDLVTDVPTASAPPLASAISPAIASASLAFASFARIGPSLSPLSASTVPTGSVALPGSGATLDATFGTGGKRVVALNGQFAKVSDAEYVQVQVSPGVYATKIMVVGSVLSGRSDYDFYIARFNADGSTDTSFGAGLGYVLTDFTSGSGYNDDVAAALAVDSAGRLIVAGYSLKRSDLSNSTLQGYADYALARYLPDGRIDTSFSSDGVDLWDVGGPSSDDRATGVVIQKVGSADRYLVVGTAGLAFKNSNQQFPTADVLAARWESGGSKDTSFNTVRIEFGDVPQTTQDYASAVALDADGNAWIAGNSGLTGGTSDIVIAGISASGAVIAKGKQDLNGGDDKGLGITLADGRALVVGSSGALGAVVTFNVDANAGLLGEALVANNVAGGTAMAFRDVRVDSNGRGVAVGTLSAAGSDNFVAFRFDAQTLEPETAGVIDLGGADSAYAVAIGADNKVLAVGLTGDDLAMARFKLDKPIAEVLLSFDDVQNTQFTYEENGQTYPLPQELVDLLRFSLGLTGELTVNGTGGPDDILISQPSPDTIVIDVNGVAKSYSAIGVTRIIIDGRAGDDTILADATVTIPLTLKGGDGNDVLGGGSAGDVLLGQAGNDTINGQAGNDSLNGGADNDILLGAAGNDALAGSFGRDILIGGLGSDALDGGDDDDLLIGAYTTYDNSPASLSLIQAEWVTTLHTYTNRIANLNGTGAGGGFNGNTFLRSTSKTVLDDGVADSLTGGAGLDWFLVRTKAPGEDVVIDRDKSETLTQVS